MTARMGPCGALLLALALVPVELACDSGGGGGGTPSAIVIANPRGGEVFAVGADVDIQWQLNAEVSLVNIDISRDGRMTWQPLYTDVNAADGLSTWPVDPPVSTKCHVRVSDAEDEARSAQTAAPFEIAESYLNIVSPNGGEVWGIASKRNIRWVQLGIQNVKIEYCDDWAVGTWKTPDPVTPEDPLERPAGTNPGAYLWTIPDTASVQCRVRISDADGGPLSDMSSANFEITVPSLALLTPVGGAWDLGDKMDITWDAVGVDEVRIDICRDAVGPPLGWTWTAISPVISAHTNLFTWTVYPGSQGVPQGNCRARVVNVADETTNGVSPLFMILWDVIYRVDDGALAGGDGTTWQTAYQHPQDAVTIAGPGSVIWVAQGTYGRQGMFDRVVLALNTNVSIYGGFAGWEYDMSQRVQGASTLAGGDYAYHVVEGADGALIDGFTVTGGSATGAGADLRGAGMYNYFVDSVEVTGCTFVGNAASTSFSGYGGGIYNEDSTVTITECTFSSNSAASGGGIASYLCYNPFFPDDTWIVVSKCVFDGNRSTNTSSTFRGGGGFYSYWSTCDLSNCLFRGNTAYRGAGVFVYASGYYLNMVNCTLSGNGDSNTMYGGAVFNRADDYTVIWNSILRGNTYQWDSVYNNGLDAIVGYSCLEEAYAGLGNIYVDPQFTGDLHLRLTSPCRDAGILSGAPADDLDGQARVGNPDMGCYEYP